MPGMNTGLTHERQQKWHTRSQAWVLYRDHCEHGRIVCMCASCIGGTSDATGGTSDAIARDTRLNLVGFVSGPLRWPCRVMVVPFPAA